MSKKNFFFILYSVCSGIKIFPELANTGYVKAFWHLIILAFICSIGFSFGNIPDLKRSITEACLILNQEFGGIAIEKNGIYPKIGRDKEHHIEYRYFQMDYFPQEKDVDKLKINTNLYDSGIIWTPVSATGWLKISNNQAVLYPVLASLSDTSFFSIHHISGISNYIKQAQKLSGEEHPVLRLCMQGDIPIVGVFLLKQIDSFDVLIHPLVRWSSTIIMLRFFLTTILNVLFYSLIFALIYRFMSKDDYSSSYTFKTFFVIAVYASFPPIIIGTLLGLAQTQWLDYSTIFIITFVVYLFFILNSLKSNKKDITD